MTVPAHFLAAGALSLVAVFAGWRGARPPNLQRGPRLVPWRFIMLLCAAAAVVTAAGGLGG